MCVWGVSWGLDPVKCACFPFPRSDGSSWRLRLGSEPRKLGTREREGKKNTLA